MQDAVQIRLAAVEDKQALEAVQWRASLSNAGDRAALLAHPDAIELPVAQILEQRVFVAECDGVIAGFAVVLPRADGEAELDGLFVDPACFRRGIGRALVERCAELARRSGSRALHVVGNDHAQAFYEACGFEAIGTTETRFGAALLLRKALSPAT